VVDQQLEQVTAAGDAHAGVDHAVVGGSGGHQADQSQEASRPTPAPFPRTSAAPSLVSSSVPAASTRSASSRDPYQAPALSQVPSASQDLAPFQAAAPAPNSTLDSVPESASAPPVPAPRTSFSRQRNLMGLRVDIESARRRSVSEAASEPWSLTASSSDRHIHTTRGSSLSEEEDRMVECGEDFYDDDWNMDMTEDKDTQVAAKKAAAATYGPEEEDGEDAAESFAFDDEIEFLTHLEAVSDRDSNKDDNSDEKMDDDDEDVELDDALYDADYHTEERFFLHTIHEDSFEKEDDLYVAGELRSDDELPELDDEPRSDDEPTLGDKEPRPDVKPVGHHPEEADSPFRLGGHNRSTIRSKKGQRRRQSSPPQQETLKAAEQEPPTEETSRGRIGDDKTAGQSVDEQKDMIRSPDREMTTDRRTMRKPIFQPIIGRRTDPMKRGKPTATTESCDQPDSVKSSPLKIDIKTWEERRGAKNKPLPLKCVFSTYI
jgi:hypothetical protein